MLSIDINFNLVLLIDCLFTKVLLMDSIFQFCVVKENGLKKSGYGYIQIKLNAVNGHQGLFNAVRECSFHKRAAKRYCFIHFCAVDETRKIVMG